MPDNRSEDQHDPDERIRTIVLAEFSGLRGEIATRVNLLATMIIANLTVLGVVFGIALNSGNTSVLLVLPFITPSLGVMYIDQQRNLIFLGNYIRERIYRQLQIDDPKVFGWGPYIRKRQFSFSLSAPYLSAMFVQFLIPVGCVKAFMQLVGTREAGLQGGRVGVPGLAEPGRQGQTGEWTRRLEPKRSVWAMLVVVLDIDSEDLF